jgi:hypothetical protein
MSGMPLAEQPAQATADPGIALGFKRIFGRSHHVLANISGRSGIIGCGNPNARPSSTARLIGNESRDRLYWVEKRI